MIDSGLSRCREITFFTVSTFRDLFAVSSIFALLASLGRLITSGVLSLLALLYSQSCFSDTHHPQVFLKQIAGNKREGELIVQHYCVSCHGTKPLIQLGAPRIGHSSDWLPRLSQPLDNLLQHTYEGYQAMPARGGCFECTDEQLMLAILALLPSALDQSLKNDLDKRLEIIKKSQR